MDGLNTALGVNFALDNPELSTLWQRGTVCYIFVTLFLFICKIHIGSFTFLYHLFYNFVGLFAELKSLFCELLIFVLFLCKCNSIITTRKHHQMTSCILGKPDCWPTVTKLAQFLNLWLETTTYHQGVVYTPSRQLIITSRASPVLPWFHGAGIIKVSRYTESGNRARCVILTQRHTQ